jgi:hypothetical protein
MLLCDQIVQGKASLFRTAKLYKPAKEALGGLQREIAAAQKFVLDRSLAVTADAIEATEVERVVTLCRLPFDRVWIECLHADRPNFYNAPVLDEDLNRLPHRIGLLARTHKDNPLCFLAHLIWSFGPPINDVSSSVVAMLIDLNDEPTLTMRVRKEFGLGIHTDPEHLLENRAAPFPSIYFTWMLERMAEYSKAMNNNRIFDSQMDDWNHEPTFWWAVLALLNSRNVVEAKQADLFKLNRSRKHRGVLPLSEHKVLKLRLPGALRGASGSTHEHSDVLMRGHFVRGHFKKRATGLYYWSNFFRGDPTRTVTKTYEVGIKPTTASKMGVP